MKLGKHAEGGIHYQILTDSQRQNPSFKIVGNEGGGYAVYYQNPMNAYVVDLAPLDTANAAGNYGGNVAGVDALLSEGVVVHIAGLGKVLGSAPDEGFVEIEIPLDDAMLAPRQA